MNKDTTPIEYAIWRLEIHKDNPQIPEWSLDQLKDSVKKYQETITEIFRKQG